VDGWDKPGHDGIMADTPKPLTDKIALVTGASRGIGRAAAIALGAAGAHVIMAVRTVAKGEQARAGIEPTAPAIAGARSSNARSATPPDGG